MGPGIQAYGAATIPAGFVESRVTSDRPAFRDLETALLFGYYGWHAFSGTVEEPSFVRFIPKDSREQIYDESKKEYAYRVFGVDTDRVPEGYDAAAQAGLIKAFVEAMPEPEKSHIKAKFLLEHTRAEAKAKLVERVLPTLPTGIHKRQLIFDLVSRFYGKRGKELTFRALQKRYDIGRYELTVLNRRVLITLDAISVRAETRVYEVLQQQGVIA